MINTLEYLNPLNLEVLNCIAPVNDDEREAEEKEIESLPEYQQVVGE